MKNDYTQQEKENLGKISEDFYPRTEEEEQFNRDAIMGINPFKKNNNE